MCRSKARSHPQSYGVSETACARQRAGARCSLSFVWCVPFLLRSLQDHRIRDMSINEK
jgi:hypothetical protein